MIYLLLLIIITLLGMAFSTNATAQPSTANTSLWQTNATTNDTMVIKNMSSALLDSIFNKSGSTYTLTGLNTVRQWYPAWLISGLSDSLAPYVKIAGLSAAIIASLGGTPQVVTNIDTLQASRAFNTSYRESTTKQVQVCPSAEVSCSLSLLAGQDGTITMQTSPDNATWTSKGSIHGSNTGALTVGLSTVQVTGSQVCALIPPGGYWRLTTTNNTGTPTFTMKQGQKVIY